MTTTKENKEFLYGVTALIARYEYDQRGRRIKQGIRAKKERAQSKKSR